MVIRIEKWYSNGLNDSEVRRLKKGRARIGYPCFGKNENGDLSLQFKLHYGVNVDSFELESPTDILNLLNNFNCRYVSELAGKTVEFLKDDDGLKGIRLDKVLFQ